MGGGGRQTSGAVAGGSEDIYSSNHRKVIDIKWLDDSARDLRYTCN